VAVQIRDLPTHAERVAATEGARQAAYLALAARAVDDPVKLARAARIVRVALERKRLTIAELLPDGGGAA
jgi:hypothetical protein